MNSSKRFYLLVFLVLSYSINLCVAQNKTVSANVTSEREIAKESDNWSQLFIRNHGWFGGDGIYGIPLDGKEFVSASDTSLTLFTFGDTMIGHHDGKKLEKDNFEMINNSVGLLKGKHPDTDKITFHYKVNEQDRPESLFVPTTEHSKKGDYYWLGDGFVNMEGDQHLYIFAYPVQNVEKDSTGFGFEQIGVNLLKIPLVNGTPIFNSATQVETPFFDFETQTSFGSAIFVNTKAAGAPRPDGFVYVYAVSNLQGRKGLLLARVHSSEFSQFENWQFWNGSIWTKNMKNAKHIAWDVSNEMSVSPLSDGKVLLVYQYLTLSDEVTVRVGESLVGPFKTRKTVYKVLKDGWGDKYFPYNSKAYPHLSSSDSILISYNVNSFDFFKDIVNDPNLYRPRFIKLARKDF